MSDKPNAATERIEPQTRFYLIFEEMEKVGADVSPSAEELDEIDRVSRMAHDVDGEEPPFFMTST
jgi:hypothetical protein